MNLITTIRNTAISLVLTTPGIALAQFGEAPVFAGTSGESLVPAIVGIINVLLILAAVFAAIFLVLGGVRYITSQGSQDQVDQAKNTILYAVIGLIVIGLSAAIVNFVVGAVGG